jgi:quinol monooxygenase YgiN
LRLPIPIRVATALSSVLAPAAAAGGRLKNGIARLRFRGDNPPVMNTKPLTVVAILKAKPGHETALRQALLAAVPPTRKEKGCLNYDLHEVQNEPGRFLFHENWTSRAELDAHIASPHIKALFAKFDALLAEPAQLVFCDRIV